MRAILLGNGRGCAGYGACGEAPNPTNLADHVTNERACVGISPADLVGRM